MKTTRRTSETTRRTRREPPIQKPAREARTGTQLTKEGRAKAHQLEYARQLVKKYDGNVAKMIYSLERRQARLDYNSQPYASLRVAETKRDLTAAYKLQESLQKSA